MDHRALAAVDGLTAKTDKAKLINMLKIDDNFEIQSLCLSALLQQKYATFKDLHAFSGFDSFNFVRMGKLAVLGNLHKRLQL